MYIILRSVCGRANSSVLRFGKIHSPKCSDPHQLSASLLWQLLRSQSSDLPLHRCQSGVTMKLNSYSDVHPNSREQNQADDVTVAKSRIGPVAATLS